MNNLQFLIDPFIGLIYAIIGGVFVLLGAWKMHKYWLKQEEFKKAMEMVEKQLNEFYSPIYGIFRLINIKSLFRIEMDKKSDESWRSVVKMHKHPGWDREAFFEKYSREIEYNNKQFIEEIIPMYKEMAKIIKDKYWLAEDETKEFFSGLVEFIEIWDRSFAKSIPTEVMMNIESKDEVLKNLYVDVESKVRSLKSILANSEERSNLKRIRKMSEKQNLRIQRHLRNWTALMALGALAAAVFTYKYVWVTKDILKQARDDSMLEYRPYVSAVDYNAELEKIGAIIELDSLNLKGKIYRVHYGYKYSNPGKTPALELRSASQPFPFDSLPPILIERLETGVQEANTYTALLGDVEAPYPKHFHLVLPENYEIDSTAILEHRGDIIEFKMVNFLKIPIYCHTLYRYWDFNKRKEYEGKFLFGIIFKIIADSLIIDRKFIHSYTME